MKKRILIVEDSTVVVAEMKIKLTELGYEVVAAVSSGEESIAKIHEYKPDLVLMDIRLSGEMDGIEAAKEIRKTYDFPVLFISAFSDQETISRAKETAPYGFIVKPFGEAELAGAIEIALKRHEYDRVIKDSENRYRILFEDSPISIWEEDFSEVREIVSLFEGTGVDSVEKIFSGDPGRVKDLVLKIKLLNVNKATLKLVGAKDKFDLAENIEKTYSPEFIDTFRDAFISLSKGESAFESYSVVLTLSGEKKDVFIKGFIAPEYNSSFTRVLISMIDISDLKNTEEDLFKQWLLLTVINRLFLTTMIRGGEEEIVKSCIEETCDLTGSDFVFFS